MNVPFPGRSPLAGKGIERAKAREGLGPQAPVYIIHVNIFHIPGVDSIVPRRDRYDNVCINRRFSGGYCFRIGATQGYNMNLHGQNYIGRERSAEGDVTYRAYSTLLGRALDTDFHEATTEEVDRAITLAGMASAEYRALPAAARAGFLDAIAEELLALGDDVITLANQETALPEVRLTGERMRTVNQLKMFAALVREGSWVDARIDHALPDRKPLPRPDLRRMLVPVGPVAVFGASNFPFAFSVAGGDTASALAAGCPVVAKAHPAHPGVSEMVASAVLAAAEKTGMPDGVFSLLHGQVAVGQAIAAHPLLEAITFTGSLAGGRALFDAVARRPRPIPVFAEMGSVNPVFVLPNAVEEGGAKIAAGLAQSVCMGVGQFCTNPGIVVGLASPSLDAFLSTLAESLPPKPSSMLTKGIAGAFSKGVDHLLSTDGVTRRSVEPQPVDAALGQASPAVFAVDAQAFLRTPSLSEEVFGPETLVVACRSVEELLDVAHSLAGQLTATVHGTPHDLNQFSALTAILETKVGRIVFNGFPTGVEVSPAMQHGGPYPAASVSRFTSVGTAGILRFVRPLCWQDAPQEILPPELQDANPNGIRRLVDAEWN